MDTESGVPKGNRTPVAGMKTRCPGPLDDGDVQCVVRENAT